MSVKLLAFAASARANSFNRRLLAMAVREAEAAGAQVTLVDYDAFDAPLYKDLDNTELPPGAAALGDSLLAHDGLLLASPEYNWSMPGSLKNLIDWLSVDKRDPLSGRTALLLSASPSTRGGVIGLTQLRVPLEHLHMWVYPQIVAVGDCEHLIEGDAFVRPKDAAFLRLHVAGFVEATQRLRAA